MSGLINVAGSKSSVIGEYIDTAKAWVSFDHNHTTSFNSSYNVSSITDNGTGNQSVNFIRKNLEFHSLNLSLFFEKSYKMRNN